MWGCQQSSCTVTDCAPLACPGIVTTLTLHKWVYGQVKKGTTGFVFMWQGSAASLCFVPRMARGIGLHHYATPFAPHPPKSNAQGMVSFPPSKIQLLGLCAGEINFTGEQMNFSTSFLGVQQLCGRPQSLKPFLHLSRNLSLADNRCQQWIYWCFWRGAENYLSLATLAAMLCSALV